MRKPSTPNPQHCFSKFSWMREHFSRSSENPPLRMRISNGLANGIMSAIGAVAAYVPTQWFGLREGFWGAITAVAVVQTEFGAVQTTARDQFAGAAIGGGVALVTILATGQV